LGLCAKVLVVVGMKAATGVASVRRCQELPSCHSESVSAGFKTDLSLGKPEPINSAGSIIVINVFQKG